MSDQPRNANLGYQEGLGAAGAKTLPCGSGLPGSLSSAEANLRGCMELLGQLNAKL